MAEAATTVSTAINAPIPNTAAVQTPQAPISTDPPPPAPVTPTSFDWKASGIDDSGMVTITERGFKTPGDLLTSYRSLETATGVPPERLIKLPAPNAAGDPKAWDQIYNKMGRPETAEKYVLPLPEGDKGEFANAMKPILHKAGLSQSQAHALTQEWNQMTKVRQEAAQKADQQKIVSEDAALRQEWGPDYAAKEALVEKAANEFGMTNEQLKALHQVLGPKAAMQFVYNIGAKMGVEDTTVPGMSGQGNGFRGMTREMAKAKIDEYRKIDSGFAQLLGSKDPKTAKEARDEMTMLQQIAYPEMRPVR